MPTSPACCCRRSCFSCKPPQVFFTKVPPTVTTHQLIQLFTACGEVIHVELFTPWPGAKISKGCGLVEFARGDAAAAAVDSLHQAFTWPHSHSPLVVEWLDSKRQAANRASKLCKQSSSDGAAGPIRRALTVPMDRNATSAAGLATSAVYSSPAGAAYASAPGQLGTQQHPQHGSRSCPLPRLQPAAAGAWVPAAYAAYMHPGMLPQVHEQADYSQQQQQGDAAAAAAAIAASGAYWWPLHPVSSGTASATSTYDNSGSMAGLTASSTLSNSSTVMQLAPADMSASSLACFSVSSAAVQLGNTTEYSQQDMASFRGCQSPVAAAATSLAMAATAALGAGRSHPAWQQLQQQNIMLLQPISNPMEDVGAAGAAGSRLLPAASSGFAAERQALQMSSAAAAAAAGGGGAVYTSLPAASGSLPQQQLAYAQLAACSRPLQQQQQQQLRWWSGYQQAPAAAAAAPAGSDECMIMLPLSARQLQVMSAVLPEVPRLTGAKALLSGCSIGSGVQLVVTGQASEVRAAHSVVAMLITNLGVDEPLLPAGMTQQQR